MFSLSRCKGIALILLLLVFLVAGCGGSSSSSGGLVFVKEPRKAEVHPVGIRYGPEGPEGTTFRTQVTVEPNKDKELRVGFFETEVGGTGPMWRASGWMAVVMSSTLLGVDINDYQFTMDVAGLIDGPSAGALMTITVLSVLLSDKVKPDATMTGTINPDGTIGPVGAIPQKIEGAAKGGKKLVLIPLGQRYDKDLKTGQVVDNVDKGQRLGVEVREVGDIYEAYEALTGKKLPKPEGIVDQPPELPSTAFEKVKSKAKEWLSRYQQERSNFMGLEGRYRQPYEYLGSIADGAGQKANSYFEQGLMAGAYAKALQATLYMTIASESARLYNVAETQGVEAVAARLRSVHPVITRIDGLIDRLKVEKPQTSTDALVLADAYTSLALSIGLVELADEIINSQPEEQEDEGELRVAALYYALANHLAQVANDSLDIGLRTGTSPAPDPKRLEGFAEILRRAAEANLNYFDSIIIDDIAKKEGVHPDTVRREFRAQDFDYTFALAAVNVLPSLKERLAGGEPAAYATLGGALASYQFSSAIVAKYYSLDVEFDEEGSIVGVARERAMIRMLDFAEKRTRELVALAKKTGNDPIRPVVYFEEAKINREGVIDEKISSLQSFWLASLEAELMAIFSGKFKLVR